MFKDDQYREDCLDSMPGRINHLEGALAEALFRVEQWTAAANQLAVANAEKANEIRTLRAIVKEME